MTSLRCASCSHRHWFGEHEGSLRGPSLCVGWHSDSRAGRVARSDEANTQEQVAGAAVGRLVLYASDDVAEAPRGALALCRDAASAAEAGMRQGQLSRPRATRPDVEARRVVTADLDTLESRAERLRAMRRRYRTADRVSALSPTQGGSASRSNSFVPQGVVLP